MLIIGCNILLHIIIYYAEINLTIQNIYEAYYRLPENIYFCKYDK